MILITGGLGYIGSHLVESLIALNQEILIIDNLSCPQAPYRWEYLNQFNNGKIHLYKIDICDRVALNAVFQTNRVTTVIHLAGLKSIKESIFNPSEYFKVNYEATKHLITISHIYGVQSFLFGSTAALIHSPSNMYAQSKHMAEIALFEQPFKHTYCLRFSNPIGHNNWQLRDAGRDNLMPKVFSGTVTLNQAGLESRDFISIQEVIHCIKSILLQLPSGLYEWNISTGNSITTQELVYRYSDYFDIPITIHELPLVSPLTHTIIDNSKITNDLGIQIKSLDIGKTFYD